MQATQRAVNRKISKRPVFFVVTTDRLTDEFPELKVRQKPAEENLNENTFYSIASNYGSIRAAFSLVLLCMNENGTHDRRLR